MEKSECVYLRTATVVHSVLLCICAHLSTHFLFIFWFFLLLLRFYYSVPTNSHFKRVNSFGCSVSAHISRSFDVFLTARSSFYSMLYRHHYRCCHRHRCHCSRYHAFYFTWQISLIFFALLLFSFRLPYK